MLKQLVIQLSSNNQVDPELLLIVTSSKSITELRLAMEKSIKRKKEENNQLQKLNEAYQQAQQQLNAEKLNLDKQKLKQDYDLGILKITTDKDYKGEMTEIEKRRVELEALQLIDNNPKNNEVKNT